jgi:hypothetical protein
MVDREPGKGRQELIIFILRCKKLSACGLRRTTETDNTDNADDEDDTDGKARAATDGA